MLFSQLSRYTGSPNSMISKNLPMLFSTLLAYISCLIATILYTDKRHAYANSWQGNNKAWLRLLFRSPYPIGIFSTLTLSFAKFRCRQVDKMQLCIQIMISMILCIDIINGLSGCGAWSWSFAVHWKASGYPYGCVKERLMLLLVVNLIFYWKIPCMKIPFKFKSSKSRLKNCIYIYAHTYRHLRITITTLKPWP